MPARRLPLGLLAPVSLVVLVAALGALQYRWVGQVGEAEREQLRQSLDRRAREFADDFDREIGRAYQVFRVPPGFLPSAPDRFAEQYDEWQSVSRFPGLVKSAYFVVAADGDQTLHRYSPHARSFETIAWPETLAPVRDRLSGSLPRSLPPIAGGRGTANVIAITALPILPDVPAILIPETQSATASARTSGPGEEKLRLSASTMDVVVALRKGWNHAVLELDREYIASIVLPALAERHFPETGADRFRISVVDTASRHVFSHGPSAGQTLSADQADAAATFFGVRIEAFRSVVAPPGSARGASGSAAWSTPAPGFAAVGGGRTESFSMVIEQHAAAVTGAPGAPSKLPAPAGWTLLLQHGAGSLDAAVARARRRNLWLSFGILGVLAASAGLVMINARRSEKLAAQQMDFVATVSHELRTPLAVIRSAAQNLSAGVIHEPGQAQRYGELIESEGRRLTEMVEQVLEYAGLSGNRRPPASQLVDIGRLARDVVSASESLPEADRVVFEVRVEEHTPAVMADEDAIRRALINLISNAVKHAADGGWIGVTVARGIGRDDGHVLLSVADRGRGIPPAELAHVFEPFYRGRVALDRQIHGNGLGLSLVKRIVEAHGGRVTVKSELNHGATFTLHLPVAADAVAATPVRDARAAAALNTPAQSTGGQSA